MLHTKVSSLKITTNGTLGTQVCVVYFHMSHCQKNRKRRECVCCPHINTHAGIPCYCRRGLMTESFWNSPYVISLAGLLLVAHLTHNSTCQRNICSDEGVSRFSHRKGCRAIGESEDRWLTFTVRRLEMRRARRGLTKKKMDLMFQC